MASVIDLIHASVGFACFMRLAPLPGVTVVSDKSSFTSFRSSPARRLKVCGLREQRSLRRCQSTCCVMLTPQLRHNFRFRQMRNGRGWNDPTVDSRYFGISDRR